MTNLIATDAQSQEIDSGIVDLFEITREDRDFRITDYLSTLVNESKRIADRGSKKVKLDLSGFIKLIFLIIFLVSLFFCCTSSSKWK